METIFRFTGHLCGEFTGHRWIPSTKPVTRSFDIFFDLRLNKRLSKQWWGWWFETPSHRLRRHCIVLVQLSLCFFKFQSLHLYFMERVIVAMIQGCCAILDICPELTSNLNLAKYRSLITFVSVNQSFWNFVQSTAMIMPCNVQNFKVIESFKGILRKSELSWDLSLRWVSVDILYCTKTPVARPTNGIPIDFEIRSKFRVL